MDSNSSLEIDSPNTADRRRFGVVGGEVTDEERNYLIRNGLLELGEDGEYHERSTLLESMVDVSTEEDEDDENKEPQQDHAVESIHVETQSQNHGNKDEDLLVEKSLNKSKSRRGKNKKLSLNCTAEADGSFSSNHSMQLRSACRKNASIATARTPSRVLSVAGINSNSNLQSPVVLHFNNNSPARQTTTPCTPGGKTRLKTPVVTGPSASTPVISKANKAKVPLAPSLLDTTGSSDNQTLSTIQCPATFCSPLSLIESPGITEQESLSAMRLPALFQTPAAGILSPASRRKLDVTVNFVDVSYSDVADQIAAADSANNNSDLIDIPEVEVRDPPSAEPVIAKPMVLRDFSLECVEEMDDNIEVETPAENVEINSRESSRIEGIVEEADDLLIDAAPSETPSVSVSVDAVKNNDNSFLMEDIEEIICEASNSVKVSAAGTDNDIESFMRHDHDVQIQKPTASLSDGVGIDEISDTSISGSAEVALEKDRIANVGRLSVDDVDVILEDYAASPSNSTGSYKGIDAISPSCVAEEISLNDTTDSLADISLDDISNGSFNLERVGEEVVVGRENLGDSFTTCPSQASTASYGSCNEELHRADRSYAEHLRDASRSSSNQRDSKSFEDLDDTITLMEKLLHQADQLEEQEMLDRNNQLSPIEPEYKNAGLTEIELAYQNQEEEQRLPAPLTPVSGQYSNDNINTDKKLLDQGFPDILPSPSVFGKTPGPVKSASSSSQLVTETETIFATPAGPAPRAKNLNLNLPLYQMDSPGSPMSKAKANSKTRSPATINTPNRNSPSPIKSKADVLLSPSSRTRGRVAALSSPSTPQSLPLSPGQVQSQVKSQGVMPRIKVTPKRLKSILDSPGSRVVGVPGVSAKKLNSPRALKTPSKTKGTLGLPILSPVANYIHSVPTPTQIKRIPPPKVQPPPPPSPFGSGSAQHDGTGNESLCLNSSSTSTSSSTSARKTKSSLPVPSGNGSRLSQHFRAKEGSGLAQTKLKELAPRFYVGPDQVKPVSGSASLATPLSGSSQSREITPVSQRHLGKRDSNNASMVNQQPVTRAFCPERFGFQSHK